MRTEALKALFALLEADEDDFAVLLERFGIDPATDLQNCDLTGVNFGRLTAETLDLTGSDIEGADLSQVNCKRILGIEAATSPMAKRPERTLDDVMLSISRYQNSDWALNQIIGALEETSAPAMAFYDSAAEQDLLTKRVCAHFGDSSYLREGFNAHASGLRFLWFYSKGSKAQFKLNPAFLDKVFFEALRSSNTSDDIGIYPLAPNRSAVGRVKAGIRWGDYQEMREDFVRNLRKELSKPLEGGLVTIPSSTIVFSGFPPMSKRLYSELREKIHSRSRFIFLCSSTLEAQYEEGKGALWRRQAVPAYSIGTPKAVEDDVHRLHKRIAAASGGKITLSTVAVNRMANCVGEPLSELKKQAMDEARMCWVN
ncbi:pentapeptide repeat-containing protein [Tardiphaga robiniae]|uniref:Pentapeptide repeat-containing protein n=1 Tax=Tardiphaga robiniae TaxID=943830 RepID=A0A163Z5G0_9BRAD|nr:pentapeptide repeat-containing protein [Tardiphaga robiniae]KZD22933.1 hypothetical protein A4A58_05870 [Tardiphaga robiniae]